MASKNYIKKLKEKLIIVLSVICLFSFSVFALVGCKDEDNESYDDGTYSVTTEDDGLISNQAFSFKDDYINIDKEDFPLTSPTGWTKSVDSAPSSAVDSGTVNVTEENWKALLSKLYDDADFAKYLQNKYEYDNAEIKRFLNEETPSDVSDEEVKNYVIDHLLIGNDFLGGTIGGDYKAPATHQDAGDNYVYMLNNYLSSVDFGLGTAQKATSASTVSLEKNKTYKLSVWVKTINVSSYNPSGDFGATIRLSNNFNSTLQAEYRITNIIANDWTEYSLYIKTDKDFDASFTLSLGLGLGNGSSTNAKYWTEGTALFDDVTFEEVDSIPSGLVPTSFTYGSTEVIDQKAGNDKNFFYNLDLSQSINNFATFANVEDIATLSGEYTKSNVKIGNDFIDSRYFDGSSSASMTAPDAEGVRKVTLKNSSYTIKLTSSDFSLASQEFAYFVFYLKSDLVELAHKSVTVDVLDKYNGTNVNRASVASYTQEEKSEWTKCSVLIKNNFKDLTPNREFDLSITFGPSNIAGIKYTSEFATGTVEFKDLKYLTGSLNFEDETIYPDGTDDPKYKLVKLFENSSSVTSLYAGYSEDYKDASDKTVEYAIKSAPGNMGEILTAPTNAIGFTGVTYNHSYVKKQVTGETLETAINDRIGAGNSKGQAGLINTKYLSTYGNGIDVALNHDTSDDPIQVLMINNKEADSYGYITPSKTLNANAIAKVSVTLRVVGDAKAYIYLVNTYNEQKEIMEFVDFTNNTDIVNGVENGKEILASSNKFELSVDSSKMNHEGWVTVNFYLATGEKAKQFRLEVWNGSRDGENKSQGFVFIKNAEISITDDAFKIPARWADSFSETTSPLFNASRENLTLYAYQQPLNEDEIAYNKEYPESAVSYSPNYVWAKNDIMVFASFRSIESAYVNPYDNVIEEEENGCSAQTDPSTFWLSFSTILLGVVLILAIIVLFIKNIRRRRKYYGKENKNVYKVQSRIKTHRKNQKKLQELAEKAQTSEEEEQDVPEEEVETEEQPEQEETEQDLDSYVYGEVQDFGEENSKDEE